jgi:hypothetical protein
VAEQLTPKAFLFYGSEEHSAIMDALESTLPSAVVAITGKHPALCGALDPFPLIEDEGCTVPTVSVSPADARPLIDDAEATIAIRPSCWPAGRECISTDVRARWPVRW